MSNQNSNIDVLLITKLILLIFLNLTKSQNMILLLRIIQREI